MKALFSTSVVSIDTRGIGDDLVKPRGLPIANLSIAKHNIRLSGRDDSDHIDEVVIRQALPTSVTLYR